MTIFDRLSGPNQTVKTTPEHELGSRVAALSLASSQEGETLAGLTYRCDFKSEEEWGVAALSKMLIRTARDPFLRELYGTDAPASSHHQHEHVRLIDDLLVISDRPIDMVYRIDWQLSEAREFFDLVRPRFGRPGCYSVLDQVRRKTVPELKAQAKQLGLHGYSTLKRKALIEMLLDHLAPVTQPNIAPGWFQHGDLLIVPRGEGAFAALIDGILEAVAHDRLMAARGSLNPFGASIAFIDAGDVPQPDRDAMIDAERWHEAKMAELAPVLDAARAAGHGWYFVGNPRHDETCGETVYWVNGHGNGVFGWYSLAQIADGTAFVAPAVR